MKFILQAACGCCIGKIRKNNEDNFYFDGQCLEQDNSGLEAPISFERKLRRGECVAVFDGMGGENFGEVASYAAAWKMLQMKRSCKDWLISDKAYLEKQILRLDDAVVQAQAQMGTNRMGTTMVGFYFSGKDMYVCNVGDSRAYRLREGELQQMSVDHVEKRPGRENKKAPLTQHLGLGSADYQIEPYIAKERIQKEDVYLLCSDGLTDMLMNAEIAEILESNADPVSCVETLISAALEHGGRDNISVIVCRLR